MERDFSDDIQNIWDNVNELQELTNITTTNIEDIYDKDILKLQNFQNLMEGELSKLKAEVAAGWERGGETVRAAARARDMVDTHDLQTKLYSLETNLAKLRQSNRNTESSQQSFRDDLNTAYADIDELKKEKQSNAIEIEQLKRYISQLEVERLEEAEARLEAVASQAGLTETIEIE